MRLHLVFWFLVFGIKEEVSVVVVVMVVERLNERTNVYTQTDERVTVGGWVEEKKRRNPP